ncbi:Platinum sensitivity protein [Onygenales sp. PD_40]|nr:Platinum sensitivity protein [Onygenales sp. PD_40]
MMASTVPPQQERKRVKVYELRDNDWFDRGTGLCSTQFVDDEPKIFVESEDEPDRMLLETSISRDDGYQKQQETLIVWTEQNGIDMALSFQEAEGCAAIWDFISSIQSNVVRYPAADDSISEDIDNSFTNPIVLPPPELGNLADIEMKMRHASAMQPSRDSLTKFIMRDEYILKLLPLVNDAEDLESLPDLHRLCNIMKSLILLNDNSIIELVVSDHVISGVVGALEYDPDFPTHKANHRQYLNDRTRYKEVVPIKDPIILRKIRHTWRLQYLKDVVLARILDDPTFSVLNSLIFFNQVDIVQHLQSNTPFLNELFAVFNPKNVDNKRKEDAVQFLHQCAAIAKNLQAPARANLFANFISHGLFSVIAYAVKHPNPALRTTGIDILVALLDHDPLMMRGYMLKAVNENKVPLTDTLIDLLHAETDLGVKNQLADAIKVLLDPHVPIQDPMSRAGAEFLTKLRAQNPLPDSFVQNHFDDSAKRLFAPLKELESRQSRKIRNSPLYTTGTKLTLRVTVDDLTFQEASLHSHLVDILTFFVRQHYLRCRGFMHGESLTPRVAQLLTVPQKHLKLTALKFFRTLISLQDTFYVAQMTHNNIFELILNIVYETMPRDNLLNSACLELFEFIKRENIKTLISHIVEKHRDVLKDITYVDTFQNLILRYDQMQGYGAPEIDATLFSQDESSTPRMLVNGGQRWQGVREMDAAEEEYFDTSDDEEDEVCFSSGEDMHTHSRRSSMLIVHSEQEKTHMDPTPVTLNGSASPIVKPLVDYPDDDDEDAMDVNIQEQQPLQSSLGNQLPPDNPSSDPLLTSDHQAKSDTPTTPTTSTPSSSDRSISPLPHTTTTITNHRTPPTRYSEKRRREEDDDDDELVKLSSGTKRRSSSLSSVGSAGSGVGLLRRKKSFTAAAADAEKSGRKGDSTTSGGRKIAINLSLASLKRASPVAATETVDVNLDAEEGPDGGNVADVDISEKKARDPIEGSSRGVDDRQTAGTATAVDSGDSGGGGGGHNADDDDGVK